MNLFWYHRYSLNHSHNTQKETIKATMYWKSVHISKTKHICLWKILGSLKNIKHGKLPIKDIIGYICGKHCLPIMLDHTQ